MADIIIYHNPRCGKSREALAILQKKDLPYSVRLYLADPLSKAELKALLRKLRITASALVRTNEDLYKTVYKGEDLSEPDWIAILSENPILIERPIIGKGAKALIARPPKKIYELLIS